MRVETLEQFEAWVERGESSVYLVDRDGEPGVALVWSDEDGEWHGVRPVDEDDGPWKDLPRSTRETLAVRVDDFGAPRDDDSFAPFTVLWPLTQSRGVDLIAAERRRQVTEEGYTPDHDAAHSDLDLALAAAAYATPAILRGARRATPRDDSPAIWPWHEDDWKPSPDDRVRELTKAGSLIAAEVDRLLAVTDESEGRLP